MDIHTIATYKIGNDNLGCGLYINEDKRVVQKKKVSDALSLIGLQGK